MYYKKAWFIGIIFLIILIILAGCQYNNNNNTVPGAAQTVLTYSDGLPSRATDPGGQITEYVIALDQSFSMDDVLEKRNKAAVALLNSLPDNSRVAALAFNTEGKVLDYMLPMSQTGRREQVADHILATGRAGGGTDLGKMMENVIELFDGMRDSSVSRSVFVVTDGASDGNTDSLREARDQKFFDLCEEYRDRVHIYVVFVSNHALPENLAESLHTEPITLEDSTSPMNECRSSLTVWKDGESAKILSIPDIDQLETALLNFRCADADAIYNRSANRDTTTISFPVEQLCVQDVTVMLSGGNAVRDVVRSLQAENGGENLLDSAETGPVPSMMTLHSDAGLTPGLYTMDITADSPLSIVIACTYSYQIQYGFVGAENPLEPPANRPLVLQMQLLGADGSPLELTDSVKPFIMIMGDETSRVYNGQEVTLPPLNDGEHRRVYPGITYAGLSETLSSSREITPADEPPPADEAAEREGSIITSPLIWITGIVVLIILIILIIIARICTRKRRGPEIRLDEGPVQASIRWKIEMDQKTYIGGCGLFSKAVRRQGCDLAKWPVYVYSREEGTVVQTDSPLTFALWRYSGENKCTELILEDLPDAVLNTGDEPVLHRVIKQANRTLKAFGVNKDFPYREIRQKTAAFTAVFQLEYCSDQNIFYQ